MRKLVDKPSEPNQSVISLGKNIKHDSAERHVSGTAIYIDDMPESRDQLHVALGLSSIAYGKIEAIDLAEVRRSEGVVDVIVQSDIIGKVDISPVFSGDLILAGEEVMYFSQPIFAVAADSFEAAHRAIAKAKIQYSPMTPTLTITDALAKESFVLPRHDIIRGNSQQALQTATHTINAELAMKGQEHFYLEGQISAALPAEEGGVFVYSSSQHPSEVQKLIAGVLCVPIHKVQVEVRRMGGGFGGKESQAVLSACIAAVFARRTGRPTKVRLPRKDDMVQTGKRHPFLNNYTVGCNDDGKITSAEFTLAADCGCTADLSGGIVDRAMFHVDNAYYLENVSITGLPCKTDKVSQTAFRGFGGPQGMITAEMMLDDIAYLLNMDPLDVRKRNLYTNTDKQNVTPYGQEIEDEILPNIIAQLETSSDYRQRRKDIIEFNANSLYIRKGLSLTPIKFGISFTTTHLNQAGALVHIYTDGSIHLNHGGTEMGQGLFTKIAQIVANEFGVAASNVMVSATRTDKVPNASPTAASAGTDMNGMAALDACQTIKDALIQFACEHFGCKAQQIHFKDGKVNIAEQTISFADLIQLAYVNRIPLFAHGFYKTPKIWYDRETGKGQPFYYFANGASCTEVTVNSLTGEYIVDRVDILHDVGRSLNPSIDIGQIEGGFIQGMGWLTTEELSWDDNGRILSNSPANYKIPSAADLPLDFRVNLFDQPNEAETVYRSKAVGEPPLMLANSVWCALRNACASFTNYTYGPALTIPATPEQVFFAIEEAKQHFRETAQ